MARKGDLYDNNVTGERAVIVRGDEDADGQPGLVALSVRPGGAVAREHVHPAVQERFRVISGRLGTRLDGVEGTLTAGEEATVPVGMPHDWWNAGDTTAEVLVELTPVDPRFVAMIATMFGLANAGRSDAKGVPKPLQLALTAPEFSDVIQFTKPPAFVQKALFGALGPIARRRGYRAIYPEYLPPHGREEPDAKFLES
jgi:mannose-6-phosphate isomerase-like protein (cupin superfamily)